MVIFAHTIPKVNVYKHMLDKYMNSDFLAIENAKKKNNASGNTGNTMLVSFLLEKKHFFVRNNLILYIEVEILL